MGLADVCCTVARGVGTFIGASQRALASGKSALTRSVDKLRSLFPTRRARTGMSETIISQMRQDTGLSGEKLDRRLQVMANTIVALQERINELVTRGPVSEATLCQEMKSLKPAESLTGDETAILLNVFRQNLALQKPTLDDNAAAEVVSLVG